MGCSQRQYAITGNSVSTAPLLRIRVGTFDLALIVTKLGLHCSLCCRFSGSNSYGLSISSNSTECRSSSRPLRNKILWCSLWLAPGFDQRTVEHQMLPHRPAFMVTWNRPRRCSSRTTRREKFPGARNVGGCDDEAVAGACQEPLLQAVRHIL